MPSEIDRPVQNTFAWDSSSGGSEPSTRRSSSQPRAANRHGAAEAPALAPPSREPVAGVGDGWLTTDEAVTYLGLPSRKALYQAVRRGQVPARRLGVRRMRFSRVELDRLLRGAARDGREE